MPGGSRRRWDLSTPIQEASCEVLYRTTPQTSTPFVRTDRRCGMNYWMWNEINGVSVVFTDDHVGVSTTCDLDDPETIAALKIAQQLSPAIKTHYDLTNHAWDYETNSINWGRIPFDVMQDFVIAVTDIPEFFRSYLSSEVLSAYFLATSPELLRAEISK